MSKKLISDWSPGSWGKMPLSQQIHYADTQSLKDATDKLQLLPPLVSTHEVDNLKAHLINAQQGKCFILQGGDCAESFDDCTAQAISQKVRVLINLSLLLSQRLKKPVICIGRIAGQYAKPRSQLMETKLENTFHSYRGDLINHIHFSESARTPDPQRLLQGYSYASLTLNYIRSLLESDLDSLFQLDNETEALKDLKRNTQLHSSLEKLQEMMKIFHQFYGPQSSNKNLLEFYTSHEALHLHYEQALTRQSVNGNWYNLSTHYPWVGMRTARPDSAHIEYLRGITNPVAIKVGPNMDSQNLLETCKIINPNNELGRLTLIHRFGYDKIKHKLAPLIKSIQDAKLNILWCCDPMHGNSRVTNEGIKTRNFDHITSELLQAFDIHRQNSSTLGGVHLELTGDPVMECVGSSYNIEEVELKKAYTSLVDPRLNISQAFELIDKLEQSLDTLLQKNQT